jgi:hypothetical protein
MAPEDIYGHTSVNLPVLALSQWLAVPGFRAQLVGQESINGQTLNHITISGISGIAVLLPPNKQIPGDRYEIYIDPETSLPARIRYYQPVQNTFVPDYLSGVAPVDIVFSDYRAVSGVLLPFSIARYMQGQELNSIQLQSVQVNLAINAQDFAIN